MDTKNHKFKGLINSLKVEQKLRQNYISSLKLHKQDKLQITELLKENTSPRAQSVLMLMLKTIFNIYSKHNLQ